MPFSFIYLLDKNVPNEMPVSGTVQGMIKYRDDSGMRIALLKAGSFL